MPVDPHGARDAILVMLRNAVSLENVKAWKSAEPPRSRWIGFPCGWVEWDGGPVEVSSLAAAKKKYQDRYFIVVLNRNANEEKSEDEAVDVAQAVQVVLESDNTLNGTVETSYVSNREKVKFFEGDYSLVAVRLTLVTRKRG
jgi:hypothetical protein